MYFEGAGSVCGESHTVTDGSGSDTAICYLLNGHAGEHDYRVEPPGRCNNCERISDDLRLIDFGRSGLWRLCSVCLEKWSVAA
jgi:hypothetical protein